MLTESVWQVWDWAVSAKPWLQAKLPSRAPSLLRIFNSGLSGCMSQGCLGGWNKDPSAQVSSPTHLSERLNTQATQRSQNL